MAVRVTTVRFPADPNVQEAEGMPWGITVMPFSPVDKLANRPTTGTNSHLLPRCDNCWAYFNTLCELEQWAWSCALCGSLNSLPLSSPEMSSSFIDLELPANEGSGEAEFQGRPVFVAAIDLSCKICICFDV